MKVPPITSTYRTKEENERAANPPELACSCLWKLTDYYGGKRRETVSTCRDERRKGASQ